MYNINISKKKVQKDRYFSYREISKQKLERRYVQLRKNLKTLLSWLVMALIRLVLILEIFIILFLATLSSLALETCRVLGEVYENATTKAKQLFST